MNTEQRICYLNSQVVCALAKIESMKVANEERRMRGESPAYNEKDFNEVPEEFGLFHNQVINYLIGF